MEKSKNKLSWRPGRLFMYLLLLVLDFFMIWFLRNYFWWIIAVVLLLLPVVSIIGMVRLRKELSFSLGIGKMSAEAGEVVPLEIRLHNSAWYPVLDCRISFRLANTFLDNSSELTVAMPIRLFGDSFLRLPLEFRDLGRFQINVQDCLFQDLLGIVRCRLPFQAEKELFVLPKEEEGKEHPTEEFLSGAAETEESKQKGSDFSEVSDIREYIPGDRIRDIHWKLSAKQETLMVKERVSVAGSELVLLLSLSGDKDASEKVLEEAFGIGKTLVLQRMPVCFLCWNSNLFQFDEYRCGSEQEIKEAFFEIYRIPVRDHIGENLDGFLKNCYPFLKTYLSIEDREGELQVEMCENV